MASKATQGKKSTQRKLTAILCADVVGYSRLMGADEEATIETLTAYRKVFVSEIKKHRGRVVDAKGDAILAEFASVVDAVNGAVEIQRELAEQNTDLPDDRRMDFRIGINLGDVVVKDDAIYGDGVNVAARLEALAEPGGICISRPVYDQVESKLNLECEYLGEQKVKNIAKPVRAYKVLTKPGDAKHRVVQAKSRFGGVSAKPAIIAGAVVSIGAAILLGWNIWKAGTEIEPGQPGLPTKPSIAVLPFDNLSGDKNQDYFADGLTEVLISQLAHQPKLFVIARNSSFTYKGKAVNVQKVGKELGVQYVLEGSVQKAQDRVRVTAQLIDARSGEHKWAQGYDRTLENLFQLQDEVTSNIVLQVIKELEVKLTEAEVARVKTKSPKTTEMWDFYARGLALYRKFEPGTFEAARIMFVKALDREPNFEPAILGLGWTYYRGSAVSIWEAKDENLRQAQEMARRVIALNNSLGEPYALLGQIELDGREYDRAIEFGRRAVALNPNSAESFGYLAKSLSLAGKSSEALVEMRRALQLNPFPPIDTLTVYGLILYQLGEYDKAIAIYKDVLAQNPDWIVAALLLIASSGAAGKPDANALVNIYPQTRFPEVIIQERLPFKRREDAENILAHLAKAGLE